MKTFSDEFFSLSPDIIWFLCSADKKLYSLLHLNKRRRNQIIKFIHHSLFTPRNFPWIIPEFVIFKWISQTEFFFWFNLNHQELSEIVGDLKEIHQWNRRMRTVSVLIENFTRECLSFWFRRCTRSLTKNYSASQWCATCESWSEILECVLEFIILQLCTT